MVAEAHGGVKLALVIAVVSIALAAVVSQITEQSVDTPAGASPSAGSEPAEREGLETTTVTASTIEVTGGHDLVVDRAEPVPLRVRVPSLDIDIDLAAVGVDADGDFDVPRSGVGWYRHGPAPGSEGSAVLAAHVDFNGAPGAFFRLSELAPGDRIEIDGDDGVTRLFTVVDQVLYDKTVLPADELFRETGDEALRLITCGGTFDADARSYLGNRVVTAIPAGERPTASAAASSN